VTGQDFTDARIAAAMRWLFGRMTANLGGADRSFGSLADCELDAGLAWLAAMAATLCRGA
jgi:hypothetical protein